MDRCRAVVRLVIADCWVKATEGGTRRHTFSVHPLALLTLQRHIVDSHLSNFAIDDVFNHIYG